MGVDEFGEYWVWLWADNRALHVRQQSNGWIFTGGGAATLDPFDFNADQIEALGTWLVEQAQLMRRNEG
jgi:hypothetical protein